LPVRESGDRNRRPPALAPVNVCSASRNVDGVPLVWFVRHAASARRSNVNGNTVNGVALVTRPAAFMTPSSDVIIENSGSRPLGLQLVLR
jgi:hypothetical protein